MVKSNFATKLLSKNAHIFLIISNKENLKKAFENQNSLINSGE